MPEESLTEEGQLKSEQSRGWWVAASSLGFVLLQSVCTAVIAISGLRILIGVGSLAAAAGVIQVAARFHTDAIRIPMILLALAGSLINVFVVRRIRRLRARPSSQWRARAVPAGDIRSERIQIALSVLTLLLVLAEEIGHIVEHKTL